MRVAQQRNRVEWNETMAAKKRIGRPPKAPEKRMGVAFAMRLDAETEARLDTIAERYRFVTRSALAREAMLLGLDVIERKGLEALAAPKRAGRPPSR